MDIGRGLRVATTARLTPPFGITVEGQIIEGQTVTVRERDSMESVD